MRPKTLVLVKSPTSLFLAWRFIFFLGLFVAHHRGGLLPRARSDGFWSSPPFRSPILTEGNTRGYIPYFEPKGRHPRVMALDWEPGGKDYGVDEPTFGGSSLFSGLTFGG